MEKKKLVRAYYFFQFSFNMLFWAPVFFEYQRRVGLIDSEIFRIQSLYYLAFCVLEIPTGYFADRFGYLRSLRLGSAALVVSHVLAIFTPGYGGILAHFLLVALARSLISGASSAYLYEFLRSRELVSEFKEIEGKARAYSLFGKVGCFAVIGVLMEWSLTLPYWLTLGSALFALRFAYVLPRVAPAPAVGQSVARPRLSEALRSAARAPWLIFLMLQGVGVFVLGRIISVNLFQPILSHERLPLASFGVVMGVMTLFEAWGSFKPVWMRRYATDVNAVFGLTLVMGASIALIPGSGPVWTLIWLCVFSLACGFVYPIQRQLMNDAISSAMPDGRFRATLLSIESILDRGVCALVAWRLEQAFSGPISGGIGPVGVFLMVAGSVTVAAMLLLWIGSRYFVPRLKGQDSDLGPREKAFS